jgi:hypothetical protein
MSDRLCSIAVFIDNPDFVNLVAVSLGAGSNPSVSATPNPMPQKWMM